MAYNTIPQDPERVVLVNPTKYLGNLLLAGGLMQAYADFCSSRNIALKIVIDESFRDLCEKSFPPDSLIFYPRKKIDNAGLLKKFFMYRDCLKQIRAFKPDIAFNIEEDSATSHLTCLSKARFTLGCSLRKHTTGYNHVLPIQFEKRAPEEQHRWYSFYDVFSALGMTAPQKSYINLKLEDFPGSLKTKLSTLNWNPDTPTIALHAGATKEYKKWPLANMEQLIEKTLAAGLQCVLLGAGQSDEAANRELISRLESRNPKNNPINLCNQLSLVELAQFLKQCSLLVGNDSGPFHLGSALGIPGLVLWGPTDKEIWGPLGEKSEIVTGRFPCDPACNKGHCLHQHRCMKEISPDHVFEAVLAIMKTHYS